MANALNLLLNKSWHRILDGPRCTSPWIMAPIRTLHDHDIVGGHSYKRHVGNPVAELRNRLSSDSRIQSASTFWTIESATASVCYLTMTNILNIIDWGCSIKPRIAIEEVIPVRTSVGFSVVRGSNRIVLCNKARMVLEKDTGYDFHIVTAFPV